MSWDFFVSFWEKYSKFSSQVKFELYGFTNVLYKFAACLALAISA